MGEMAAAVVAAIAAEAVGVALVMLVLSYYWLLHNWRTDSQGCLKMSYCWLLKIFTLWCLPEGKFTTAMSLQ
jgi:hypothetical protein